MPELLNPIALGRDAGRLMIGAIRLGTAPARATVRLAEVLAEELIDALRPPRPGTDVPPLRPEPPANPWTGASPGSAAEETAGGNGGPPAVTPAIAATPERRRRRTSRQKRTRAEQALDELLGPPAPDAAAPAADLTPAPAAQPAEPEPEHVDTEETLVAEAADPGAEDGAGPELHIDEPWQGYTSLTAGEIVDRLGVQDQAALSVVLLYERAHRARKTVLSAAERELARR